MGATNHPNPQVSSLSRSLSFGLLLYEERLKIFTDPTEGCIEAALLIDDADLCLHGCWIAMAAEELIAGESSFHLCIDFSYLMQHMTAHVELKNGITDPGILAEFEEGIGILRCGHGTAILLSIGGRSTWDVTETKTALPPVGRAGQCEFGVRE
jgi:hypothetical protein